MGKNKIVKTKRKGLILPCLLIALASLTILLTIFVFFDVESRRAYSNPGNLSSEVAIIGALIAAPLLIMGFKLVRRSKGSKDRNDELSLPNKSNAKPTRPASNDVRQKTHDEGKLKFACPLCETIVTEDDSVCPHCGAEFEEKKVEVAKLEEIPKSPVPEAEEREIEGTTKADIGLVMHCSQCGKSLVGGKFCKYCGANYS